MLRQVVIILFAIILSSSMPTSEGNIKLKELLEACPQIATSTSSRYVNPAISGQKIKIKGINYKIRYFSFEDTSKSLPAAMTFEQYAEKQNLLDMKSTHSEPLPAINFESFDFRFANLNDGVYFSMALREVK